MKWIDAEKEKPLHGDIVIIALWRPEHRDYMHFISTYDFIRKVWLDHGDQEFYFEDEYKILWWADIPEPKNPK